jgi:hypothetical protein
MHFPLHMPLVVTKINIRRSTIMVTTTLHHRISSRHLLPLLNKMIQVTTRLIVLDDRVGNVGLVFKKKRLLLLLSPHRQVAVTVQSLEVVESLRRNRRTPTVDGQNGLHGQKTCTVTSSVRSSTSV